MATKNRNGKSIPRFIGILALTTFFMSFSLQAQTNTDQNVELPDIAIVNILNGIQSDNHGLKMSCIYFAGKYKIIDISEDLVKELKKSDNEELCQMLVWSLYQIGDDKCCEELRKIVENHPSDKIRDFTKYLNTIKEYESAIAKY